MGQKLEILERCGLKLASPFTAQDLLESWTREQFEEPGFDLMLVGLRNDGGEATMAKSLRECLALGYRMHRRQGRLYSHRPADGRTDAGLTRT